MEQAYIFKGRTVDIYDGQASLAEGVWQVSRTRVTLYTKGSVDSEAKRGVTVRPYRALLEAADCASGVCLLNDRSVKVLIAMYPSAPRYVLLRLRFHSAWFLGLIGLTRRVLLGLVRIKGITTLTDTDHQKTRWLVIEQKGMKEHSVPMLPQKIGIPTFLQWVRDERLNYVVLRFYEHLPQLYRVGGDLDLLLTSKDKQRVEVYLKNNRNLLSPDGNDIRLGLHSVSGEHGIVPYYPPPLARQILNNAINGPVGSRIPAPKDAFLSFIYHTLYHGKKGYVSGIPSENKEKTDEFPENDYTGIIMRMAKQLKAPLDSNITMEELDEYMATEGWRPKLDTLAKLGETNAWIRDRFFSHKHGESVGLAVFMLREWVYEMGYMDKVLKIIVDNDFVILRHKILGSEIKRNATQQLRGGTWGQNTDGSSDGWLPAVAIVAVDKQSVKLPPSYASGYERFRIRNLKNVIRNTFDTDDRGSVHSTDTARESWDYVEVCFPDEKESIKKEFSDLAKTSILTRFSQLFNLTYIKHSLRYSIREYLIKRFLT